MKSRNPAFENSLACLQHPLTLLSIAILLLNDHALKIYAPSWLTGKLRDFAGLFFFPFIVAAGLSLAFSKFSLSRERIGQIAFGIVAIWFGLLKTVPVVNSLTTEFASLFVGGPTRLIMDWTDLVALAVMIPAWRMWQRRLTVSVPRRAYFSLAIGVIASLASSPAPAPFENVIALAYQDGFLYAQSSTSDFYMQSSDLGKTWREDWMTRVESIEHEHKLPIRACDPVDLQTCYQVDGTAKVAISLDGGYSWQIAWEIPLERRDYATRFSGNIITHDLIIADEGGTRFLFVALGKHGILRRQLPYGEWIQFGVEEAQPTPFYAPNLLSAIKATKNELGIWLGVALISLLITHTAIWIKFAEDRKVIKLLSWIYFTFNFALLLLIVALVMIFMASLVLQSVFHVPSLIPLRPDNLSGVFAIILAIVAVLTGLLIWTNRWLYKIMVDQNARPKVISYTALSLIGVLFFGYLPWLLWAFGIVERYPTALTISILVSVLITTTGYYLIQTTK